MDYRLSMFFANIEHFFGRIAVYFFTRFLNKHVEKIKAGK